MVTDLDSLAQSAAPGVLVIIDGNNFLFMQSPHYGDYRQPGFPGHEHQEKLIEHVLDLLDRRPDLSVDLWFDNPTPGVDQRAERLRVIQSGGKGKNRADRGILAFLKQHKDAPDHRPYLLITQDKKLRKRGRPR
ncbi:MAG: mS29 family ribosomal protein [Magnetococcus sp. WYHC-3]